MENKTKKLRTKQRLIQNLLVETAIEMVTAKGFDSVRVDDITKKVGIARRTFFLYFATKEDVVLKWLDEEWQQTTEILLTDIAQKHTTPLFAFYHALIELASHMDKDRRRSIAVTQSILETPSLFGRQYVNQFQWEKQWAQLLREAHGRPKSDALIYEIQAASAFSIIAVTAHCWIDDRKGRQFRYWLKKNFSSVQQAFSEN